MGCDEMEQMKLNEFMIHELMYIKSGPFIVKLRSRSGSGPVKVQSMSDLKRYLNISEDLKR